MKILSGSVGSDIYRKYITYHEVDKYGYLGTVYLKISEDLYDKYKNKDVLFKKIGNTVEIIGLNPKSENN